MKVALIKEFMDQLFLTSSLLTNFLVYYSVFQGTDAFSQSGLYSNHQDIGPRYAVNPFPFLWWSINLIYKVSPNLFNRKLLK